MVPENIPQVQAGIREQLERVKGELVGQEELDRAKRQTQVNHVRSNQTAEQQASSMARDFLATGDAHFSDHYVAHIQKVTVEQLREVARKYFDSQKEMIIIVSGQPLPDAATEKPTLQSETQITKITLKNELTVLLKRNGSVPLVSIQMYVLGGVLGETEGNSGISNLMAMASMKGTESYSAEEIADYFDRVGGHMTTGSGNNTFYYNCEVIRPDFSDALTRFSEISQKPSFIGDEVEKVREEALAILEQVHNSWRARGERHFRDQFFINSPYRRTRFGYAEVVEKLSVEELQQFHQTSMVGSRAVLAIFGDIDIAEAEKLVRQHFSSLPKGEAVDLSQFAVEPVLTKNRQIVDKTDKNGATVYIGYPGVKLTDIHDRYPMQVMQEIVGSHNGWLFEKLRGAQLVYDARGVNFPSLLPGYFAAIAQCEADKVVQVIEMMEEVLAKATTGEITEEELARAKSNRINSEILSKQTNSSAATSAALDELYGFGFDWSKGYADRVMAVTLEDVKTVVEKYLTAPTTTTIITSAPEILLEKIDVETQPG
jgi:zinc protease